MSVGCRSMSLSPLCVPPQSSPLCSQLLNTTEDLKETCDTTKEGLQVTRGTAGLSQCSSCSGVCPHVPPVLVSVPYTCPSPTCLHPLHMSIPMSVLLHTSIPNGHSSPRPSSTRVHPLHASSPASSPLHTSIPMSVLLRTSIPSTRSSLRAPPVSPRLC